MSQSIPSPTVYFQLPLRKQQGMHLLIALPRLQVLCYAQIPLQGANLLPAAHPLVEHPKHISG